MPVKTMVTIVTNYFQIIILEETYIKTQKIIANKFRMSPIVLITINSIWPPQQKYLELYISKKIEENPLSFMFFACILMLLGLNISFMV